MVSWTTITLEAWIVRFDDELKRAGGDPDSLAARQARAEFRAWVKRVFSSPLPWPGEPIFESEMQAAIQRALA